MTMRLIARVTVGLVLGASWYAAPVCAAELVDDAQRRVELPDAPSRVFAAGAPAEVLLYTLVPEMLVGRNHQLMLPQPCVGIVNSGPLPPSSGQRCITDL